MIWYLNGTPQLNSLEVYYYETIMFLNSILLDTMVYYGCCYPKENQLKIGSLVGPAIF